MLFYQQAKKAEDIQLTITTFVVFLLVNIWLYLNLWQSTNGPTDFQLRLINLLTPENTPTVRVKQANSEKTQIKCENQRRAKNQIKNDLYVSDITTVILQQYTRTSWFNPRYFTKLTLPREPMKMLVMTITWQSSSGLFPSITKESQKWMSSLHRRWPWHHDASHAALSLIRALHQDDGGREKTEGRNQNKTHTSLFSGCFVSEKGKLTDNYFDKSVQRFGHFSGKNIKQLPVPAS